MPPIASGFLKRVRGKVDLLIIITLDKSELLLHSLQPMISYHRILSSRKDRWVGSHETMIPTKQWRLSSILIGLHVLQELRHSSHHLLSCLTMGFIPLKNIHPCWDLASWRWRWRWIVLVTSTPSYCCLRCGTSGVNHPTQDTSLDMF